MSTKFIKLVLPDIENCLTWAGDNNPEEPFTDSELRTLEKLHSIKAQMQLQRELNKLKPQEATTK